jgi:hypothetical protein
MGAITLLADMAMAAPKNEQPAPLAFVFEHADEAKAKTETLPYFRVFPDGKDKNGKNATRSLATLKLGRGESKLYKDEDNKPGLIVVLRRIVLIPQENGDHTAILEGEFNAVKTVLTKKTMDQLFSGKVTDLVFESESTKGVRPVAFTIKAKTRFRAALKNGDLVFYGGEGASTVKHYALTGTYTYESDPVSLGPDDNTEPVYLGRPTKPVMKSDGTPETLPIIN